VAKTRKSVPNVTAKVKLRLGSVQKLGVFGQPRAGAPREIELCSLGLAFDSDDRFDRSPHYALHPCRWSLGRTGWRPPAF